MAAVSERVHILKRLDILGSKYRSCYMLYVPTAGKEAAECLPAHFQVEASKAYRQIHDKMKLPPKTKYQKMSRSVVKRGQQVFASIKAKVL